jgi:hypothetical protein
MAQLPATLPLLLVRDRVLLPSSLLRVVVSRPRSVALVESLLALPGGTAGATLDSAWVGAVSLLPAGADAPPDALEVDGEGVLHPVGCAARVLQISRFPGAPGASRRMYVLLLEGRLRFRADAVEGGGDASSPVSYFTARVTQLERPEADLEAAADDPELAALAPELEGKVRVAFVDVDAEPAIAEAFQVRGIPALFLLKDGEVVDAWTGYSPRAAVKQRLESHVGKIGG